MFDHPARTFRIVLALLCCWAAAALTAWFALDPVGKLVGGKAQGVRMVDARLIARADLAQDKALLEKTLIWGMQRNGQVMAEPVVTAPVERRIVWSVAATVVRPNERFLLILDQGSKVITQVNIGDRLPDGSTLHKVELSSYSVKTEDGKRRTVDTSL